MKRLDSYIEFAGEGATLGSLREAVQPQPTDGEPRVLSYLERAPTVLDVMERLPDVLDGAPVAETGSIKTDGTWWWREDLAHYVRRHHLRLAPEFLAHVAANPEPCPALADLKRAISAISAEWSA